MLTDNKGCLKLAEREPILHNGNCTSFRIRPVTSTHILETLHLQKTRQNFDDGLILRTQ